MPAAALSLINGRNVEKIMEDFIANGLENGNSIIPVEDSKHFLVARVEGNG